MIKLPIPDDYEEWWDMVRGFNEKEPYPVCPRYYAQPEKRKKWYDKQREINRKKVEKANREWYMDNSV